MAKATHDNALKQPTDGALTRTASHRRALGIQDILQIGNKDPNRVYRWISRTMLDKFGGMDRRGWEVLTEKNSKGEGLMNQWGVTSEKSDMRVGDLVAAFVPLDVAEEKRAAIREANTRLEHVADLKRKAALAGASLIGGFQTQRQGIVEGFGTPLSE